MAPTTVLANGTAAKLIQKLVDHIKISATYELNTSETCKKSRITNHQNVLHFHFVMIHVYKYT